MWLSVFGFLLLLVMAITVLPVPRVRRLVLLATARLVQAVLLALIGTCGTFFVQPDAAPGWLVSAVCPLMEGIRGVVPNVGSMSSGLPWLLLAASAVLIALPVLIVLELSVCLSRQTSLVQALRKELGLVAAWVDSRLSALGLLSNSPPPVSQEAQAAVEVFRATAQPKPTQKSSHVLDLMK